MNKGVEGTAPQDFPNLIQVAQDRRPDQQGDDQEEQSQGGQARRA